MVIVRIIGGAVAGALGVALVLWSGWLYYMVASSAESDYPPGALAVFGTVVLVIGVACIYLAQRLVRVSHRPSPARVTRPS